MIFGTLRFVIWIAGVLVIAYLALPIFGYKFNWAYYQENRTKCEMALKTCREKLVKNGLEGAKEQCNFECADYKSLIEKKETSQ